MATAQRVFWETIALLAFLVALISAYLWSGYRADRRAARLTDAHEEQVRATVAQHQDKLEELEATWVRRARSQAEHEARAVFTAFEAGTRTAIASRWGNYLQGAKSRFMETPSAVFLHIVSTSGRIITTSDAELASTGRLDERGDWALTRQELSTRPGEAPSILELAGPVRDNGRTVAILWIGYDLDATLAAGGVAVEAAP